MTTTTLTSRRGRAGRTGPASRTSASSRSRAVAAALAGLVAAAVAGCGAAQDSAATAGLATDASPTTSVAAPEASASGGGDGAGEPGPSDAEVAEAAAHAVAVADPGLAQVGVRTDPGDAAPASSLPATTPLGAPLHLRVLEATPDGRWLRVRVPARPTGSDGWVSADEVTVVAVRHHISVDLSDRELVLREDGEPVLTATVAVGTPQHPTPTGRFFVTDKLTTDPDSAYGAYALGVSAWSPTLSEFAGGDGQIGLHGTNEPDLLGQEVSHGCVRVSNDVITELAALLPLGVPVDITT